MIPLLVELHNHFDTELMWCTSLMSFITDPRSVLQCLQSLLVTIGFEQGNIVWCFVKYSSLIVSPPQTSSKIGHKTSAVSVISPPTDQPEPMHRVINSYNLLQGLTMAERCW